MNRGTRPIGVERLSRRAGLIALAFVAGQALAQSEGQPTENQPTENKPAENQPTENQPTEKTPAEDQPRKDALTTEQITSMSLEELLTVRVTSVAGTGTELFATPAAISVIRGEDVRRSGFRSLADAMRIAPGVFVGQQSSQAFSVGMRGFNGSLANKTLVMIDGRGVYDPLFGGTFWDVQDVFLEDLDRIEVIRGPGATLWGANAVNGVISVMTKSAEDTQGVALEGGVGTYERGFAGGRYGFKVGDNAWMRVWGKWFERDSFENSAGSDLHDDWDMARGGFRFDRDGDVDITVQGDVYSSDRIGEQVVVPVPGQSLQFVSDIRDVRRGGANLLGRIGRDDEHGSWSLQAYYDRTERVTNIAFEVERDTFDIAWQHGFELGSRHDVLWGVSARHTMDRTQDGYNLFFRPRDGEFTKVGGFIQDTITLEEGKWFAMVGSKVSYNTYTGVEAQPGARLWWTPNGKNTLWASVSRPVRVPSRTEEEGMAVFGYIDTGTLAGGPPTGQIIPLGIQPNSDLKSEELTAYEAGYRVKLSDTVTLDAAAYYNDYDRLIYVLTGLDPFNNHGFGESYGGEIAATWRPSDRWRVEGSYSFTKVLIHGAVAATDEGNTPVNMAQVRSYLDITDKFELNSGLYYVDNVPQVGAGKYFRLDIGATWHVTPRFDLSVWGQNLLDAGHREFSTGEVPRGVYVMGTVRF